MATCGSYGNAPVADADCEDCVQVVRTTKRVQVPCTRNTYKQYTIKVPRQVTEERPRTVNYTVSETRHRSVPYQVQRPIQKTRLETQAYQVPKTVTNTRMVNVTKKVPKTIYVDVVTQVPQQYTTTVMESKTRQVRIPYTDMITETKYRNEQYQVPVSKSKTVMDKVVKTVYDTQVRTQCVPETKMVTKEIPVYNVVARPTKPCPPGMDCGQTGGSGAGGFKSEFNALDTNNDGAIDFNEYAQARMGMNAAGTLEATGAAAEASGAAYATGASASYGGASHGASYATGAAASYGGAVSSGHATSGAATGYGGVAATSPVQPTGY